MVFDPVKGQALVLCIAPVEAPVHGLALVLAPVQCVALMQAVLATHQC